MSSLFVPERNHISNNTYHSEISYYENLEAIYNEQTNDIMNSNWYSFLVPLTRKDTTWCQEERLDQDYHDHLHERSEREGGKKREEERWERGREREHKRNQKVKQLA